MPGFKLSRSALQEALSPGCSGFADWVLKMEGELVPSGYVKIAIENDHRNSGLSQLENGDFL